MKSILDGPSRLLLRQRLEMKRTFNIHKILGILRGSSLTPLKLETKLHHKILTFHAKKTVRIKLTTDGESLDDLFEYI